jgi:SAM-dependent methyltransferase
VTTARGSNEAATAKYDEIAGGYDGGYQGPRWDLYDAVTLDVASTFLPKPPARVLDAGAGSGKFSLKLLARGYDVTLLDPSAEMLRQAREKIANAAPDMRPAFVQGTIEALDFPDAAFDFVFCEGDPLSYCIGTRHAAARELLRVLRPGGGFYASVDNRAFASLALLAGGHAAQGFAAAEEGKSFDPYGVPVHAFGAAELRALFEDAGAAEVRVSGKVVFAHMMHDQALLPILNDPAARARFHALEIAAGHDPAMAGLAGHLHVVGRKP